MAGQVLQGDRFKTALGAYEGMMRAQAGGSNQDAAHRETIAMLEVMFPGFRTAYEEYEEMRAASIEEIVINGRMIRRDGGFAQWYGGAKSSVGEWPDYRRRLEKGLPATAIESIDESTEGILSRCANPKSPGDKRKGLVIGYVQSGKTANFTGLITKAVDSGYRIVIVLAGLYTNLRVQTQTLRLQKDLGIDDGRDRDGITWYRVTGPGADVGKDISPGIVSSTSSVAVLVVKKHEMRLANVAKFLRSIPEQTLRNRGVLIIDDESDQATPNTLASKDLVSTINQRIRDIWKAVPTGSYVAYTATPFANVFIDPSAEDLYPDDFITVLPEPEGYMGSEQFFDTSQVADLDDDEMIHQLAHEVPDHEAEVFTPRPKDVEDFAPEMTPTLEAAIRWFVLATAIRQLRTGVQKNSSMLVHTSQRVRVHQVTKDVITDFIRQMTFDLESEEPRFRSVFDTEIGRASALREGELVPDWSQIWGMAKTILQGTLVKIDNGESTDRLVYSDDDPQTVIAVGGGTLSRGLTLEGLVVSYFLRSSNTYDTLLQMGRWFGFRPSYRDLVRVWMGPGLRDDYAHLARVERQLRDEVTEMRSEGRTPRDFAVKVQGHPGRLEITSASKMTAAQIVHAGLGGTRRQTIYLDRSDAGIATGLSSARQLVDRVRGNGGRVLERRTRGADGLPSLLIEGATNADFVDFLRRYWVAPTEKWLQPDAMSGWLSRHGADTRWNVVLVSGPGGGVDLAEGIRVGASSRTPLKAEIWSPDRLGVELPAASDVVNIRALMSSDDFMLDLRILADHGLLSDEETKIVASVDKSDVTSVKAARSLIRPGTGAIVLYAIDGSSQPKPESTTRAPMGANGPLIGLGTIFPVVDGEDSHEFFAVDLSDTAEDEGPINPVDDEGDYKVTVEA